MRQVLCLTVRFHEGRYHGAGDWPPSPARLFQALVAAATRGSVLTPDDEAALRRLETWPPPVIAAPPAREGQALTLYVPNNDLDAVGGDPARINEIRAPKQVRPRLFDAAIPLLYLWEAGEDERHPARLPAIAERLFQLGRGPDMAFASAEWLASDKAEERLAAHPGPVFRPSAKGGSGILLPCPEAGSLDSLLRRHAAQAARFQPGTSRGKFLFVQPPKPRFRQVAYGCPPTRFVFALSDASGFRAWPVARAVELVERLRDAAAARLIDGGHPWPETIGRILVGRSAGAADLPLRPRLIPLPSIGSFHADHSIRRVVLEIPPDCPIRADDLAWAFSGLVVDGKGEDTARLVPAEAGDRMLDHYGASARRWQSVTPVALPIAPAARRTGRERRASDGTMAAAVRQALRHAGWRAPPRSIRLQREPFSSRGARAEAFARPPRFPAARLTHAELRFATPQPGPLVLGDGRFLGLGLFRPVRETPGLLAFATRNGLEGGSSPVTLARALRRATMARVQAVLGRAALPAFFSGHAADSTPLRLGDHRHLAFAFDPTCRRLLVIAPHRLEGRGASAEERRYLDLLDEAMADFAELRAGSAGLLRLDPVVVEDGDPLLGPSRAWESVTAYAPTRHAKRLTAAEALIEDCRAECRRRAWPEPKVEVLAAEQGPRDGVIGRLRLIFAVAREGPVLLGRLAHTGGGLFSAAP